VREHERPVLVRDDGDGIGTYPFADAPSWADRAQAEQRLRHIQKMEVVGRFAGGIVHDLNNILTVIVGSSQLLLDHPEVGQSAGQRVQQILDAGFRAANLTGQLLAFSRNQSPRRVLVNLNRIIRESTNLIRFLIGNRIELTTLLAADLLNISADPGQMEQVLINLCVNARDAMPQGGSILIESQNVEVGEMSSAQRFPMKPGRYVRFSVSDTGTGMDAETLAEIFEPFFTTKEPDKGTGLGLATVQCIVKHGGGYVWAESEPGDGSVFSVYMPAVDEEAEPQRLLEAARGNMRGTETILLVEEREPVRILLHDFLEEFGYTVLEAEDAEGAQQIAEDREDIAALLTDIRLPGISGLTLAACIRKLRPELKVLQMTGPASGFVNYGFPDESTAFLRKPFTQEALGRKLRDLLDREE
jgi:two-component system, cell cycle sensor histidine kinase and response regulator CckA